MIRRSLASFAALLLLALPSALAQADPVPPPVVDPPPLADPAPLQPMAESAWVRFVQASPDATLVHWRLEGPDATFVDSVGVGELGFGEVTDYLSVPSGRYELEAVVGAAMATPGAAQAATFGQQVNVEESFVLDAGRSYTVVLSGLVVPETFGEDTQDQQGGFMGWLRGLFGGDGDRDALGLRAQLIEDIDDTYTQSDNMGRVRFVHAAPGTDSVDLAVVGDGTWFDGISFGEVSNFRNLEDAEGRSLVLRPANSEVVLFDLPEVRATPNASYTVILIGTPVEDVPLDVLVLPAR